LHGPLRPLVVLRYLSVPLRTAPLLSVLFFAVSLCFAEQMGVLGVGVVLLYGLWFFTYGFLLLDHVTEGRSEPLALSTEILANTFAARPIGTFALVIGLYSLTGTLQQALGPQAVTALRLVLLAILPAMISVMSMSGRFIDALNPRAIFDTIARIPLAYAVLLLILGALWLFPVLALREHGDYLRGLWRAESFLPLGIMPVIGLHGVLISFLAHLYLLYLWLAMFACIGGTLYEERQRLDFEAEVSPERAAARSLAELERERDLIMDRLYAQTRGGSLATVKPSLRKLLSEASDPIAHCRWMYHHAAAADDQRLAHYLAQVLLPLLLDSGATGEALETVRQRLNRSADFRPHTSAQVLRLVELASAAGDRAAARRLLVDFDRHYPNDPLASRAGQLAAALRR
jgi:hypothetical protein